MNPYEEKHSVSGHLEISSKLKSFPLQHGRLILLQHPVETRKKCLLRHLTSDGMQTVLKLSAIVCNDIDKLTLHV